MEREGENQQRSADRDGEHRLEPPRAEQSGPSGVLQGEPEKQGAEPRDSEPRERFGRHTEGGVGDQEPHAIGDGPDGLRTQREHKPRGPGAAAVPVQIPHERERTGPCGERTGGDTESEDPYQRGGERDITTINIRLFRRAVSQTVAIRDRQGRGSS